MSGQPTIEEMQAILGRQIEVNFLLLEAISKVAAGEFTKEDGATVLAAILEQMNAADPLLQGGRDGAS